MIDVDNFSRRKFIATAAAGVAGLMVNDTVGAENSADDHDLERKVGELLKSKNFTVATAESCTGGLLASRLTDVSGSSAYVKGGVVSYCNEIKHNVLHVESATLDEFGAVSRQTAEQMATNVRTIFDATIGLSTTGVAGPSPSEGKPVGLVYVAAVGENFSEVVECHFSGTRTDIKAQAVAEALKLLIEYLTVEEPNLNVTDFNDETRAAMQEARLISEGKLPAKSFDNIDELMKDLMSDVDD